MPIWPVSFINGIFQVADADGAQYPITMQGNPVLNFNPGWSPRGLQTGLAPFHILELDHEGGASAFWLLDNGLDFRGNAVVHMRAEDRVRFFAHVEPLVRSLFDESVKAPHSGIPAAAHEFNGFLPASVYELLVEAADRTIGRPDLVSLDRLDELGGYGRNNISLSPSWIVQAMNHAMRPAASVQERLDLPQHTVLRHFDRGLGIAYYLLEGVDAPDRHLYVPAVGAVFTRSTPGPDTLVLLAQLIVWYATHADRAVMLPEAEGLEPELVHAVPPPQYGLDEPPAGRVQDDYVVAADPHGEATLPYEDPAVDTILPTPIPAEPVLPTHEPEMTPPVPADAYYDGYAEPEPVRTGVKGGEDEPEPAYAAPYREPVGADAARHAHAPLAPPVAPRQNWWQRLLGLGQG